MAATFLSKYSQVLSVVALVGVGFSASAQGLVNDNAKISVAASTFLIIDGGGFTNNGVGGQVTNAGTIDVDGTWTNNSATNVFGATPTATTGGTVRLDGGAQSITGSQPTRFWDLTAGGTLRKTLVGVNASVYNQITLNTGVDLNTRTLTLENSANNAILGTGVVVAETPPASGYGILSWNIGNSTVANYTVPFGTSFGTPIPVLYNIASAGTVTGFVSPYKNFSTYPSGDNNTPMPTTVTHITDDYANDNSSKVIDRFWVIENTATNNYSTYPNINLTFTYDDVDLLGNTITEANLVAQRFNSNLGENRWGDWLYSPVANTATNRVTVNLTRVEDYFPVWTLVDNSDPLPIELARFVGQCDDNGILVSWTTYTETDNDLFRLERSKNGVDFFEVEVIAGAGNSNQPINYQVVDNNAYNGTSYYRLISVDVYGNESVSQVIAVTCGDESTDFTFINAYEIDNTDLMLEFTAALNELYTVTLFDASGRIILNSGSKAVDGMNKVRMPVGDVAKGIYIVNLQNETKRFSRKVLLK